MARRGSAGKKGGSGRGKSAGAPDSMMGSQGTARGAGRPAGHGRTTGTVGKSGKTYDSAQYRNYGQFRRSQVGKRASAGTNRASTGAAASGGDYQNVALRGMHGKGIDYGNFGPSGDGRPEGTHDFGTGANLRHPDGSTVDEGDLGEKFDRSIQPRPQLPLAAKPPLSVGSSAGVHPYDGTKVKRGRGAFGLS